MDNLDQLVASATSDFAAATESARLEDAKARYLGKEGSLTALLKGLGKLPAEERKSAGAAINVAKERIESALTTRREALKSAQLEAQLATEALDVTLPGRGLPRGSLHPVITSLDRIERLFRSIGFDVADGPEIETDWHNFTALNTPENHPARSMHDTFYLRGEDGKVQDDVLLRTHTSPVQIRAMLAHTERNKHRESMPELRVICPGRVYRVDSDATHSPMFHQVEGLWVGENVSFADLKGVVADFLPSFLLPVHRAFCRNRCRLHERRAGRPLAGNRRLRHGSSQCAALRRLRPGKVHRFRFRHGPGPADHAALFDP
jgi:phenylalanyl-tRNA synthetase alpha chain